MFIFLCTSDSFEASTAELSMKRRSCTISTVILVLNFGRRRLIRLQSVRKRKSMKTIISRNGSLNMAANIMLNRAGARTQPCSTPFVIGKGLECSPLSCTLVLNGFVEFVNFSGHPNVDMISHRPSRLTVSKALARTKRWCRDQHATHGTSPGATWQQKPCPQPL